jgi:hypothetical protein
VRSLRLPRTTALLVAAVLVAPSAVAVSTFSAERAAVLRPTLDAPFPAGPVMVLGGFPERLAWARAELPGAGSEAGRVLVVSANAVLDFTTSGGDCDRPLVRCVVPDPYTTRGEAEVAAALAAAEGWDRLTVVTSAWHARRVRLLFAACLDVPLAVVGVGDPSDVPVGRLPRELAGSVEARLRPACGA